MALRRYRELKERHAFTTPCGCFIFLRLAKINGSEYLHVEQSLSPPLDTVYIVRIDGTRLGPFETRLEANKALIWEVTLNAGAGDTLEHHRPDGKVFSYLITNTHFQPKMTGIEAHYTVRLRHD